MKRHKLFRPMLWLLCGLGLLAFGAGLGYAQVGGAFDLSWNSVDGGGTLSTGDSYTLAGVVGQPDAGTHSGGQFALDGGFLGGIAPLVENTPTPWATATLTPTTTPTDTATDTVTPTSTSTAMPTDTATASQTPTGTPTDTPISTFTATATDTPINTDTATPTSTMTPTYTSTATPTLTATASSTATDTPTQTATPTGTASDTPTESPTSSATSSQTPTPTATGTATPTSTATSTSTATATDTSVPSSTPTITGTATNTLTPSITPTGTVLTSTPTDTPTITPTTTSTPTSTSTNTSTPTATPTNTMTPTGTSTATSSSTSTATATATATSTVTLIPTSTSTTTATTTSTGTPTATSTTAPASSPTRTATPLLTATPTSCVMNFSDVHPRDWYYQYVLNLYCHGAIAGYNTRPPCTNGVPCFRPDDNTTRGQISKIVVLAFNLPINTAGGPHFSDVTVGSTFYNYVETLFNAGAISGYGDGTFRPGNEVTRAQLTKIIVLTGHVVNPSGWQLQNPPTSTFEDVPAGSTFYRYIETAYSHRVIDGYRCGISPAGECVPPGNKPYFVPYGDASRAQISKIASLAAGQTR